MTLGPLMIDIEGLELTAGRGPGMGYLCVFFFLGISAVADNTAVGISH